MQELRSAIGKRGYGAKVFALALALTLQGSLASAAKWNSCPAPPFPTYPSLIGATNSPFVHPGHDLTIVLNEEEVAASGGFSTQPDGNEIQVRFLSPAGTVKLMPPIWTDASPASLTFAFPEALRDGLPIVGPVEIVVVVGMQTVAHIAAEDLVALPRSNDVEPMLFGSGDSEVVYGAVGADGDLWVPAHIDGTIMEKPTCPGDFVPVLIQVAAARIDGNNGKREPLRHISGVTGYLGDVTVFDYSLYGMPFQNRIRLVHVESTLGVSICQLNDAVDIVLRIRGKQSWTRSARSPFESFVSGSYPVGLILDAARTPRSKAWNAPATQVDTFDNECSPRAAPAKR